MRDRRVPEKARKRRCVQAFPEYGGGNKHLSVFCPRYSADLIAMRPATREDRGLRKTMPERIWAMTLAFPLPPAFLVPA